MADNIATTAKTQDKPVSVKTARAFSRYVHISARKARLVADLVRGKSAAYAIEQLRFNRSGAARPILKTILSAVANAENNFHLNKESLRISLIKIDMGPAMKRWKPRAYGRASMIKRPTSHIFVEVEEIPGLAKTSRKGVFPVIPKRVKKQTADSDKQLKEKREQAVEEPDKTTDIPKGEKGGKAKKPGIFSLRKKLFNRKGGEK